MSGVLCAWANIPKDSWEWYENQYIPDKSAAYAEHALHCKVTSIGMEDEPTGKLDAPWDLMTVYEMPRIDAVTKATYEKENYPSEALLQGPLKDSRFDIRTYREIKRWQQDDWEGGRKAQNFSSDTIS